MRFNSTDLFDISDDCLSQEVNEETVLLDLKGESYFSLNDVGTRIWQLIQSEQMVSEVLETLFDEYDVSKEQLEIDVGDLLDKLAEAGLVSPVAGV
jgi:hypothetical protein